MTPIIDQSLTSAGIRTFPSSDHGQQYALYEIIRRLVAPYVLWPAYRAGIIDAHGNILRKVTNSSFTQLDALCLKLKKLLEKSSGDNQIHPTRYATKLLESEVPTNVTGPAIATYSPTITDKPLRRQIYRNNKYRKN